MIFTNFISGTSSINFKTLAVKVSLKEKFLKDLSKKSKLTLIKDAKSIYNIPKKIDSLDKLRREFTPKIVDTQILNITTNKKVEAPILLKYPDSKMLFLSGDLSFHLFQLFNILIKFSVIELPKDYVQLNMESK